MFLVLPTLYYELLNKFCPEISENQAQNQKFQLDVFYLDHSCLNEINVFVKLIFLFFFQICVSDPCPEQIQVFVILQGNSSHGKTALRRSQGSLSSSLQ